MDLIVEPGGLAGTVPVPGSKSHTIRGLIIGMLAGGVSRLARPLRSSDTESCMHTVEALGARVAAAADDGEWRITGTGGRPQACDEIVDVGNSGTTLFLAMTAAALADGCTEFTGDEQIRARSAQPLIAALRSLGATAYSVRGTGCAPLVVGGGLDGGRVRIECPTSQYLSSLLIGCPLAGDRTTIEVPLLNERPYARMTLGWLDEMGIRYEAAPDMSRFELPGGQEYPAFNKDVPADFSSATFFLVAAAVTGSRLFLGGLDMADTQGDKAVVEMLKEMGCTVSVERGGLSIEGPDELRGGTFDLNATPDALPGMAVAGCLARGETRLTNVPQARIKETDRIATMAQELGRMGAEVTELPDGMVLRHSRLRGAEVEGHGDHRVVMALAVAALAAEGPTTTFPNFVELVRLAGAEMAMRS